MTPLPAAPAAKALKLHDVQRSKAMSDLELTVVLHPYSNNGELVHEHLRDHVTQILWQADPRAFEYTHRTVPRPQLRTLPSPLSPRLFLRLGPTS